MPTGLRGGYGISALGRSEYGNAKSDIEPRFSASIPLDGQLRVPVNQVVKFEVYGYSSVIDIPNIRLEISENGGASYSPAFDGTNFLSPYTGKIRRPDGQRLWIYISKTGNWSIRAEIIIRFTGTDEYGQEATRTVPVKWET